MTSSALPAGFERTRVGDIELVARHDVIGDLRGALEQAGSLYHWAAESPQPRALRGRAPVYVAQLPSSGLQVAMRHVWHGGTLAPVTGDRWIRPGRALVELQRSVALQHQGVPTAPVLGFALYPAGPSLVRIDVVTEYLHDAIDLAVVLAGLAPDMRAADAMNATHRLLVKLADARQLHPDLNVKNVLVRHGRAEIEALVIDVDVMQHRPNDEPAAIMRANVERLLRSVQKWQRQTESELDPSIAANLRSLTQPEPAASPSPPVAPLGSIGLDRICIVMMSAVGDAVHVMPVINAIKKHKPSAHITWVLQPGPATLVRGHPLVDDIIVFDRSRGWKAFVDVRRELRRRSFDLVLALQVYFKAGLVTSFAPAPVKLGFDRARARDANWLFTTHRIPARAGQHVQDQYFEFLEAIGVPHGRPVWGLAPWNEEERSWQRDFALQFDRPVAAIVVATSKPQKDWLPDRWARVCHHLWNDYGLQPVLVGGRSTRELDAERAIMDAAPFAFSALGSGLRKLAAILDASAVALSPDTGPLHLAVALRTPVISLVGYTNPKRVGPYDFARDLMIDAYGDPGEDYPLDMTYRLDRMDRIGVSDVLDKLEVWERRYASDRIAELNRRGLVGR